MEPLYTHQIQVEKLRIKKNSVIGENVYDNVVVSCWWNLCTHHINHPEVKYTTSNCIVFPLEEDVENFIKFEDITEETIVSWIEQHENMEGLKFHNENVPELDFGDGEFGYITNPFGSIDEEETVEEPVEEPLEEETVEEE